MLKYVFLCFSLFAPVKLSALTGFKTFRSSNSQIVCMAPPPGGIASKALDGAASPSRGCTTSTRTKHHTDGSTTTTMICTKQVKKNSKGKVIKETDTSSPGFKSSRPEKDYYWYLYHIEILLF